MEYQTLPNPDWNNTTTPVPSNVLIHQLFEQQVLRTPTEIAFIDGQKQYSYAFINSLTNKLAHRLRALGITKNTIIGCYLNRSSAIVICTIAILKAGGTYIMLDSNLPLSRLEHIIKDAQINFVLTDTIKSPLSLEKDTAFLSLSGLEKDSITESMDNLNQINESDDIAYISYTSGSTGDPKGVMISHRAMVNHAIAFASEFKLNENDRLPLLAPFTFDMAIEEMIPPLLSGCTLVLSNLKVPTIVDFHYEVAQQAYTLLNLPASLWLEWCRYMSSQNFAIPSQIQTVIVGSEEVETKALIEWKKLRRANEVRWVAAYGTTETTITSTLYTSGLTDDISKEAFVPIGKPIANTYTYILDESLHPLPVGKTGELYIGGLGVALGYFRKEELTKERFISDLFSHEPGARMYRTGDLAYFRPDGNIVWVGRSDDQFKINGLRIEPGEIEAVLNSSPDVQKSVAILHRDNNRSEEKKIVAFIVSIENKPIDVETLRQLVTEHLSFQMIPDIFIQLPNLPTTLTGKIDRKYLEQYDI